MSEFTDHLDIIIPALSSILTGIGAYIIARRKQSSDTMKILLDANESFRNEIRKDLAMAKERIQQLENQIEDKNNIISDLQIQIISLTAKISAIENK